MEAYDAEPDKQFHFKSEANWMNMEAMRMSPSNAQLPERVRATRVDEPNFFDFKLVDAKFKSLSV